MKTTGSQAQKGNFYGAMCRTVIRRRWWVIGLTFALLALSSWTVVHHLTLDTSLKTFMRSDATVKQVLDDYRAEFGRDDVFLVVIEGDVFTPPFIHDLRVFYDALLTLDFQPQDAPSSPANSDDSPSNTADFGDFGDDDGWGDESGGSAIEEILSLVNAKTTRREGDSLRVMDLIPSRADAATLTRLRSEVLADRRFVDQLVSRDGKHTVLVVRTQHLSHRDMAAFYSAVMALSTRSTVTGFRPYVAGGAALNATFQGLLVSDLRRMVGFCVLGMFLALFILFRQPMGILAPLLLVGVAGAFMMATMAISGMPLTMVSNILPAFLFCVGICHAVHLVSVFRDRLAADLSTHDALIDAVSTTATPIIYTSLTTIVGLLSFRFATIDAIQEMGLAGALGIFFACVLSLTFLPALLSFHGRGSLGHRPNRRDVIDRFLSHTLGVSRGGRRRWILVSLVILGGLAAWGISRGQVYHNPVEWIPEDTEFISAFKKADGPGGGVANVQLLIEAENPDGVYAPALLDGIVRLSTHISAYQDPQVGPLVRSVSSIVDLVEETHRNLRPAGDSSLRPDTVAGVAQGLLLFENSAPDVLRRFVVSDRTRAQVTVRSHWLEATSYRPFIADVDEGIARLISPYCPSGPPRARCEAACARHAWCAQDGSRCHSAHTTFELPSSEGCLSACLDEPTLATESCEAAGPRVRPTGAIYTLVNTVGTLIDDLLRSFGAAFVVITLIMVILLRGPRLGLIAMVPNLLPIIVIMGLMGFTNIPIDVNNLLLASISIGLAVDDTIHYLHHFRRHWIRTGDLEGSLNHAVTHTGRAIVSTTVILMLGFGAFIGAEMANVQRFGFLVSATALFALLIDLIYAPALLRTFFRTTAPKESQHANH